MSGDSVREAKEALRREMRARLRAMSPRPARGGLAGHLPGGGEFARLHEKPVRGALRSPALGARRASADRGSVAQGKRVVLPLMIKHGTVPELDWHEVTRWDDVVVPGPFGLREPDPLRCARVKLAELDCAFVPGVAFDAESYRLGRGGGFYDSFLGRAPAALSCIGLFFSTQKVERVPREGHDQRLRSIITEDELTG